MAALRRSRRRGADGEHVTAAGPVSASRGAAAADRVWGSGPARSHATPERETGHPAWIGRTARSRAASGTARLRDAVRAEHLADHVVRRAGHLERREKRV